MASTIPSPGLLDPRDIPTPPTVFDVVVIGAGLGGLGTAIALRRKGHNVTVLEAAAEIREVGAGIQIPPNSTRILHSWGLKGELLKKVVWPKAINMRRYDSGKVIGLTPLDPEMEKAYGYAYHLIHRHDYQLLLLAEAKRLGCTVHLSTPIASVTDSTPPVVNLSSGSSITADLVIGADGIKSLTRATAVQPLDPVEPRITTQCAYRATVPAPLLRANPKLSPLLDSPYCNLWIGYRRHIMAYPIQNGQLYNMVMAHPVHPGKAVKGGRWNEPGDVEEMKAMYAGWDPIITEVLKLVPKERLLKWTLADLPTLERWVSKGGRVALIGDAAHAMVQYLAQGAAQAIEDAATIGEAIGRCKTVEDIPAALAAYQRIRKPRCERIQKGSVENGDVWHMPDGPEQEARDLQMGREMREHEEGQKEKREKEKNPNMWSDEEFQPWMFGHDAVGTAKIMLDHILGKKEIVTEEARAML